MADRFSRSAIFNGGKIKRLDDKIVPTKKKRMVGSNENTNGCRQLENEQRAI